MTSASIEAHDHDVHRRCSCGVRNPTEWAVSEADSPSALKDGYEELCNALALRLLSRMSITNLLSSE